jgi:GNAT superfamily N-acetyltransferase
MRNYQYRSFRLLIMDIVGFYLQHIQNCIVYKHIVQAFGINIKITEATTDDLRTIGWHMLQDNDILKEDMDNITVIVAKWRNKIVGYILLIIRHKTSWPYTGAWLHGLYVRIPFRRLGIATTFCNKCIIIAYKKGIRDLFLSVKQNNHRAIQLYSHLGFRRKVFPELEKGNEYIHYVWSATPEHQNLSGESSFHGHE